MDKGKQEIKKDAISNLGVLGGTFDPIHFGHLRTAEEIGRKLNLDKVYLLPSSTPPHKPKGPVAPFHHRMEMTRLAVGDSDLLVAMDMEGRRPGLSYSIETLRELHSNFGSSTEIYFIIGSDAFLEIKTWKEYRKLFDYAHFVIIDRAGHSSEEIEPLLFDLGLKVTKTQHTNNYSLSTGNKVLPMTSTLLDISSTLIRHMVKEDKSIRYLVPREVEDYILNNGLYRKYGNLK